MGERAVSYVRVSGKGQVRGDGFPRQREAIRTYAKRHRLEVTEEYRDEGVSGTRELEGRAGLAALIDHIESNGAQVLLVENATRLARDLMVQEVILGQFRQLGVKVLAADSGTELTVGDDDPTRVLIRQVLGAVSQFEKSTLTMKLRAARARKRRETGKCEGRKRFGEWPGEQAVLRRIKDLSRKPRLRPRPSLQDVADKLNSEGVTTRYGKAWTRQAVHVVRKRL